MLGNLKGLMTTFIEFFKPVVTAQYPQGAPAVGPQVDGISGAHLGPEGERTLLYWLHGVHPLLPHRVHERNDDG